MSDNKQQIAIVTGGTRGIGREITEKLISDGFRVVAFYHGNEEAAKKCEADTGAKPFKVDVADFDACKVACQEIEITMGPIAVLVNNAGITRDAMLHKMTEGQWDEVIATNLKSCFNMCSAVMPYMRDRSYGRIVNISSINGQKGQLGQTNYAASKGAVIAFSKSLALEGARKGITVNTVCPGYIETEMTAAMDPKTLAEIIKIIPVGRMGKPEEIADAVSYLASPRSGFITGSTISINGGQLMP